MNSSIGVFEHFEHTNSSHIWIVEHTGEDSTLKFHALGEDHYFVSNYTRKFVR
jgi:hypothetical protein